MASIDCITIIMSRAIPDKRDRFFDVFVLLVVEGHENVTDFSATSKLDCTCD